MDDSIKRFKKRRSDRLKKRMDEEWITMRGTHVLIDDEGQVSKGPSNLKSLVEKSGGHKKKGTFTDLRKPNLGNVNKKPGDPSVEKYIDTLEKGGMKVGGKGSGKGYGVKYNPKSQTGGEYKVKHAEKASAESMRPNIGSHELPEDKWDLKHPNDYPYMHPEKSRLTINPDFPKQELIRGEERSFTSGGKTWDKESLTKLWQDRGYSKKQAEARAEKDLNETLAATKKNREAEEYARTGAEAARERMIERGKSGGKSVEVEKSPDKPKKPTMKGCTAASDGALQEMGGRHWDKSTPDTDVWEFKGKVSATSAATNILNGLRKKGYDAVFTTASGKVSEKPTSYIWVRDPKNDYNFVEYSVYRSKDSSAPGKTYLSVDKKITY